MGFKDYLKRKEEEEKKKKGADKTASSDQKGTPTESSNSGGGGFKSYLKRTAPDVYRRHVSDVDSSNIRERYTNFINKMNSLSNTKSLSSDNKWHDPTEFVSRKGEATTLLVEGRKIMEYLKDSGDTKTFSSFQKAIDGLDKYRTSVYDQSDFYANFKDEADYNSWVTNNENRTKYDGMTADELKAEKQTRGDTKKANEVTIAKLMDEKATLEQEIFGYGGTEPGSEAANQIIAKNKRIEEINKQIKELGKSDYDVLYFDNDGMAITMDTLIRTKSMEEQLKKIKADQASFDTYSSLVVAKEDIDTLDKVLYTVQMGYSSGDAYTAKDAIVTEDDQKRFDYISQKYGIDFSKSIAEVEKDITALTSNKLTEQSNDKELLAQQGYSWEEIDHYMDWLDDKETYAEKMKEYAQFGIDHPVASTIMNILAAPTQVFDYAGNLMDSARSIGTDEDSFLRVANIYDDSNINAIQASSGAITNQIGEKVLEKTDNETLSWLASTAYSGVTSSVQSAVTSAACVAMFGPQAGATISLGLQASQAASAQFNQSIRNGSTNGEALGMSIVAGTAEYLFEKLPLDQMLKNADAWDVSSMSAFFESIKGGAKGTLFQGLTEAFEETGTSLSTFLADQLINGDHSEYGISMRKYMDAGYTQEEASKKASKDFVVGLLGDAVGGFIGGFSHSGATTLANTMVGGAQLGQDIRNAGEQVIEQGDVDALKALANEMYGVSDTKQNAKLMKLAENVTAENTKKNIKRVGNLATEVTRSTMQQSKADIQKSLIRDGMSEEEATEAAEWMSAWQTHQKLGKVYHKASTASQEGKEDSFASQEDNSKGKLKNVLNGETEVNYEVDVKDRLSDNGKTVQASTGETIAINKENAIARIEMVDGERVVCFNTDKGEVLSSDVQYSSESEGLLYESFVDMRPAYANAVIKNYDGKMPVKTYIDGMREGVILYGMHHFQGVGKDISKDSFLASLSAEDQAFALNLGSSYAEEIAKKQGKAINVAREDGKSASKGRVSFEQGVVAKGKLQKRAVTLAKHLASAMGINIVFYDARTTKNKHGKRANGYYDPATNTIHLDMQNSTTDAKTIAFTLSHELTHYIKEWSPQKFDTFAKFLMEQYAAHGVSTSKLLANKMAELGTDDADFAYEEMICDACETMLLDSNAVVKLMELRQTDLALFEKIKLHIRKLLNKIRDAYRKLGLNPTSDEAKALLEMKDVLDQIHALFEEASVDAVQNYQATIGSRNLEDFAAAETTDGKKLFQYKALKADEDTYKQMLKKWGKMSDAQIENLFETIDKAMDIIKDNLEVLDYAWEADINDRAFSPVKPNSDSLYKVSLDYSTLCRKRILQQTIQAQLQEALNQPLTREDGIAICDALISLQEEGRQIEVACALCYVESARMKSPAQIQKFLNNREVVLKDFFASKSGGSMKEKVRKAEVNAREKLHKENPKGIKGKDGATVLDPRTASLKSLPKKYADAIRDAKKAAKASYKPTAEEQKLIEVAKGMTVSDFTSPEGLEKLAKEYPALFDAYTSYVRNATKSKGIENDTWWRAGDSEKIGDVLIANMNKENGLRSQSWSDFQVIHILDYIASTIELATRNTKEQAYSKVPDYIELMGQTGVMLNMSLIPTQKFDGKLEYDSVEGMAYKRALELREKYPATAGTICIGIDNKQIQMLLADTTIDYVIPYHKSGMAAAIRKLMHIPTWSQYEDYQSEKELSDSDAKKNAEKYGVKLLDKSDHNYHKHTSFSEWFDLEVAKRIAKMENSNPSNKEMQEKYGVMYGGYMAMQDAANNYLKLCAERGLSPKFSHEKADFTVEDNYWKLLIDRKMVNNATGEIIEQQTIQPIFDEEEILRILNDELDRYPSVKEDQDYAVRKVTEKFLSGEVKSGMSAEAIAKVMQKPVDNITKTNIVGSDYNPSVKFQKKGVNKTGIEVYETSEKIKALSWKEKVSAFEAELNNQYANKTARFIRNGHTYYAKLDKGFFGKVVHGEGNFSPRGKKAFIKAGADGDFFDLLENTEYQRSAVDTKDHKKKDGFTDYFDYFFKTVQIDNKVFNVFVNVKKQYGTKDGYTYTIFLRDNKKTKASPSVSTQGAFKMEGNAFDIDIIHQDGTESQGKNIKKQIKKDSLGNDPDISYQKKKVSNRTILSNALESAIDTSTQAGQNELKWLREYQSKIATIEKEEAHLAEVNAELKEHSFGKGKKPQSWLNSLKQEKTMTVNRLNTYDKQLLRLEAMKPIKDILAREKEMVRKRTEEKGREALAEYRKEATKVHKEEIGELKRKSRENIAKMRETRDKGEALTRLQKLVLDTSKWLRAPSKTDAKCPDVLKGPYAKFLNSIDLTSKRALSGGAPTLNDLRVGSAMESLANAIDRVQSAQDPNRTTDEVFDSGYLDLPEGFVKVLRDTAENIKSMMVDGEFVVNQMHSSDIRQLSQMIRTLNHSIKEMSTLYSNLRFAKVENLGGETITFLESLGKKDKTNAVADFVSWDNALPYYAFKRFGNGGNSIMESLMDAQDKLAFLADQIFKFKDKTWTDKQAREWSNDTHTIDLPGGGKLTLTTADAMSIYCLSRREQAKPHLLQGGVRVPGKTKGAKTEQDSRSYLSEDDIRHITSTLSNEQIKVAESIQEFMSTVCADWGNEISMKRFLTKEFTEKFYFPIESNDENLPVKDPQAQQSDLYRLLNISATKALTKGANNQIVIRNIFDVFTNHSSDMARLNSYGLALLDYMKWLNYNEKTESEGGLINVKSTKKAMNDAYGDKAFRYVLNLVKDINGKPSDGGSIAWLTKMTRNAKVASVAGNLRVAVLQLTSYPRAAMVLSTDSMAKALTKAPKIGMAKKYCGIALWKSFGFYDTNIARSIEDQIKGTTNKRQKLIELSLKGAEWGDATTWGCLWNACEYEVAKTKQYKVGTEEFNQAVAKKLREIVYATQVVDSTLTRSQVMRQKDGVTQMATAFMSEPTLSANILMDAGFQFNVEKRKTGSAKVAWKVTGKYVTRAIAVYSAGQLLAALVEGLMDAYRDDDDEEFKEKFIDAFTKNAISDIIPFNKIPVISDITEFILSQMGIGYFSSDNMSTTWLTNLNTAVKAWSDVLSKKETNTTVYNAIYNTTKALSSMSGLPGGNLMREVVTLWNNTAGAADITLKVKSYKRTTTELGQELYEAIVDGDTKQAESIRKEFADENAITSTIRKAIKENDPRIAEAGQALFDGDNTKYEDIVNEIIDEGNFPFNDVVAAVQSVYNDLKPDEESSAPADKKLFKMEHFFNAIENGDSEDAEVVKDYMIEADVDAGKTLEEAEESFNQSVKTYVMKAYEAEELTSSEAESLLTSYGGKTSDEATVSIKYVDFKSDYPEYKYDIEEDTFAKYYKPIQGFGYSLEQVGIGVDVYAEYYVNQKACKGTDSDGDGKADSGTKKSEVLAVINSLPINYYQKDALYYFNGSWSARMIYEAPWH